MKTKEPVKATKPKASVMQTATHVKKETAPKVDALPQKKVETKQAPEEPEQMTSISEQVQKISDRAKQSDQFEYDDRDEAQAIFDKLPAGEFVIKEGNKTVIQKL